MLQVGQTAPDFTLPDGDMELFDFASLRGKQCAVLFFYPKDGTPYCTQEAIDFSDHEEEFQRAGAVILGISRDDCLAHAEFADKHGISVRLLSDIDGKVGHQYGVYHFREHDGHKRLTVIRSTFIIDKQGILRHALYDVSPRGHAAEVFKLVKELKNSCKSPKTPS
jgi:peroxiredoxin Q/BCP